MWNLKFDRQHAELGNSYKVAKTMRPTDLFIMHGSRLPDSMTCMIDQTVIYLQFWNTTLTFREQKTLLNI